MAEAFAQGLRDFQSAPGFGLAFGAIFALGGIAIAACTYAFGLTYLIYPLIIGFAMIGPFAAIGLYAVSRLREEGATSSWRAVIRTVVSQASEELAWMAFVTLFIFMAWIYAAQMLVALFFGLRSFSSQAEFLTMVTTTPEGLLFLLVGNLLGAAILFVTFSLTVVAVPLLLDWNVDFVTAMITSLRAVTASPGPMAWLSGDGVHSADRRVGAGVPWPARRRARPWTRDLAALSQDRGLAGLQLLPLGEPDIYRPRERGNKRLQAARGSPNQRSGLLIAVIGN